MNAEEIAIKYGYGVASLKADLLKAFFDNKPRIETIRCTSFNIKNGGGVENEVNYNQYITYKVVPLRKRIGIVIWNHYQFRNRRRDLKPYPEVFSRFVRFFCGII